MDNPHVSCYNSGVREFEKRRFIMFFYEIRLQTAPRFLFACTFTGNHYSNRFPSYAGLLEISIIEEGTIYYDYYNGITSETPPGTLAPIFKDMHCRTTAKENTVQRHSTVGMIADYTCRKRHVSDVNDPHALIEEVRQNGLILIPYQWPLGKQYDEALTILRRIIFDYNAMDATHLQRAMAEWLQLVELLTRIVINRLLGKSVEASEAAESYVRYATRYISEHYTEKIAVADIAQKIGISTGYLHGIFKQQTGMSVLEYMNRYRVGIIKQTLERGGISLKEAAYQVGIDDPSYMSRLFKKLEGISFREYCVQLHT